MRIIDMNGNEIAAPDLTKGYLVEDRILVEHHEAVEAMEEIWHHEVVVRYPNGGIDVKKFIDAPAVEAKEAWDEYEPVRRYVLYTQQELDQIEQVKKQPRPLTVEERLLALEKSVTPKQYVAGVWYYRGDYVTYEAEVYCCVAPAGVVCVWSPDDYSMYWQKRL